MEKRYSVVRKLFRFLAWFLVFLLLLPLVVFVSLHIPVVQNYVKNKVVYSLEDQLNTKVSVGEINLGWWKDFTIKNVYIEDQNRDTLAYVDELSLNIDRFKLFQKEISLEQVELDNAYLNLYRSSGKEDFNFTFIANAFQDTTSAKSPWEFTIGSVSLERTRLRFDDTPEGISLYSKVTSLDADIKNLGLHDYHLMIEEASADKLILNLAFQKPEREKEANRSAPEWTYSVNRLRLSNSAFTYDDYTQKAIPKGMDYSHLNFSNINGLATDLRIHESDIHVNVKDLSVHEKSGLALQELKGVMDMTSNRINIELKKLQTPGSNVRHALSLGIPLSKGAPVGELTMNGNLNNEKISFHDLFLFLPDLDTIPFLKDKTLSLSGTLKGKLSDFSFSKAALSLDKETGFTGSITVKGLPEWKTAYVNANIQKLESPASILKTMIDEDKSGIRVNALEHITVKGTIKGKVTEPSIDLSIASGAGRLAADIQLKTDTSFHNVAYKGNFSIAELNVGKILKGNTPVGKVSARGFISGKNDQVNNFSGKILTAEFQGYTYQKISIKGSMINQQIQAEILAEDKSIQANVNLSANLRSEEFSGKGTIDKLDLYALHFMDSPLVISTSLDGSITGMNPDSLTGQVRLSDLNMASDTSQYHVDSLMLASNMDQDIHSITLILPEVSAEISGKFSLMELPVIGKNIFYTYQDSTYKREPVKNTRYLAIEIEIGEISTLAGIFLPELTQLDSVSVKGRYEREGQKIDLNSSIGSLSLSGNTLEDIFLNAKGKEGHIDFQTGIDHITSGENMVINEALIKGTLAEGIIHFNTKIYEQTEPTRVNMDGILRFSHDSIFLTLPSAEIYVQNHKWDLSKGNSITYAKNYLDVQHLKLSQGNQILLVNSTFKENRSVLTAQLQHIKLSQAGELAGLSSYKMMGEANGSVEISDPLGKQGIDAILKIDSLGLNDVLLGHLNLQANKKQESAQLNLDASLSGANNASMNGFLSLEEKGPVELDIRLTQLALSPLEPFVKTMLYKLEGKAQGSFRITGTTSSPQFAGTLHFPGVNRVGVNLSKTTYKLQDQKIDFTESAILFHDFTLKDSLNQDAVINGKIAYSNGFKTLDFNLDAHADNFEFINSQASPGAAFYGKLYAKMNASINGPLNDLDVKLSMVTKDGSRMFLPLASANPEAAIPSYIHFDKIETGNPADTLIVRADSNQTLKQVSLPDIDYTSFNISGDLRITKETQMNIVVDPLNGDKITATGNGSFSFNFNSQNDMDLYGTYIIQDGSYQFSFVNLVKKNFTIQKGSSISWNGDFENADLNITAYYETRASRYDLVADQADFMTKDQIDAAKRPLPIKVLLNLKGELLTPEISFSIETPEGGDVLTGNLVAQEINRINNDPNELNKQVFSLIVLDKFLPENASSSPAGGNVALNEVNKSVSRVLNSQLNKLTDDYLKGVDINVNLQSLDPSYGQFAQNAQVLVSKDISDRISVSAGGNVNINNTYGSSQFAGDYNVFYKLNSTGTISLKFFRTSTQSVYSNNLNTQTGFSLNLRREFNRWSRLFSRRKEEETVSAEN